MPFAVFRTDAGPAIGGGHVQRCLALADALSEAGWRCAFACRDGTLETVPALAASTHVILPLRGLEEEEAAELAPALALGCDLLVVDHYGRGAAFESACRAFAARIMAVDDQPERNHDCDLLLDATPRRQAAEYDSLVPPGCRLLLGPSYAVLRRQFALARLDALARRERRGRVERLLVGLGMTDPGNLTATVLDGVAESGLPLAVDVVLGSAAPHLPEVRRWVAGMRSDSRLHVDVTEMAELMSAADLAIGASGQSSFERCCVGLPSLIVVAADNQREIADALVDVGAARAVAPLGTLNAGDISAALTRLYAEREMLLEMVEAGARTCDGRGVLRTMLVLLPPVESRDGKNVALRLAEYADRDGVFAWQLHPSTRRFAHNAQAPLKQDHDRWFRDVIADPARVLLVVLHGDEPAGVLRFDRLAEGPCRLSILTAPDRYRLGIGRAALLLARRLFPGVEFHAEVLPDNKASRALFEAAGYHEREPDLFVSRPEGAPTGL